MSQACSGPDRTGSHRGIVPVRYMPGKMMVKRNKHWNRLQVMSVIHTIFVMTVRVNASEMKDDGEYLCSSSINCKPYLGNSLSGECLLCPLAPGSHSGGFFIESALQLLLLFFDRNASQPWRVLFIG